MLYRHNIKKDSFCPKTPPGTAKRKQVDSEKEAQRDGRTCQNVMVSLKVKVYPGLTLGRLDGTEGFQIRQISCFRGTEEFTS